MVYVKVTDLTDYSFCPRKVYLKRVLGLREETNYQMFLGRVVHEIFENLNESEDKIVYERSFDTDTCLLFAVKKRISEL